MKTKTGFFFFICYIFHLGVGKFFLTKTPERAWIVQTKKGLYKFTMITQMQRDQQMIILGNK